MAYRFRFYPTGEQRATLAEVFGHTRYVWDWALEQRTTSYYEEEKSFTYTDTAKRLTKHKHEKEWLSNVSSVALQQKLRDLDQAFDNFFDGCAGYPNGALPMPTTWNASRASSQRSSEMLVRVCHSGRLRRFS